MSTIRHITIFIACSFITFFMVVSAQAPAPQPSAAYAPSVPGPSSNDCLTNLLNMSDCLSFVTAGSNLTAPEKPCCPELAGLVDSNPICLCQLLGQSDSYGIKIDLNRALKLPSICKVTTPPVETCAAVGIPVGAPTASEAPMPMPMSPGGVATSPSTGNNDNGASSSSGSILGITVGFALAFLI